MKAGVAGGIEMSRQMVRMAKRSGLKPVLNPFFGLFHSYFFYILIKFSQQRRKAELKYQKENKYTTLIIKVIYGESWET